MPGIKDYSTTPAANTALFPEGMAPSAVNDGMRQLQADVRDWYNDAQWAIYGDGDGGFVVAYVSAASFSVNGADVTSVYHAGRRVKAVGALTGTIYGTITASAFATNTTVTVSWDAGAALQNEALTIYIGIVSAAKSGLPPASQTTPGGVQLATQAEVEAGSDTAKGVTPGTLAPAAMVWSGAHTFRSTDPGAGEVTAMDLDRASASPAANDLLMGLRWLMRDSGGGTDVAAKILAKLLDPAAGSEDAELQFSTVVAGSLATRLILGQGVYTPNVAGGDKGVDSLNAVEVYARGNALGYLTIATQSGAAYTLVQNDLNATVKFTNAGGCAVTLPSLASVGAGWRVRLLNAAGGNVTVTRAGSDPIDGGGTAVVIQNAAGRNVMDWWTDGATWYTSARRFFGAYQNYADGTPFTFAHGLGATPKRITVWIKNQTTAEQGWNPGDEVIVQAADTPGTGSGVAPWTYSDGTNISVVTPSQARVLNKTTGGSGVLTAARWQISAYAEY
jgi:hypothetical protein